MRDLQQLLQLFGSGDDDALRWGAGNDIIKPSVILKNEEEYYNPSVCSIRARSMSASNSCLPPLSRKLRLTNSSRFELVGLSSAVAMEKEVFFLSQQKVKMEIC